MKAGFNHTLSEVLAMETEGQRQAGKSDSHLKAVMNFMKKSEGARLSAKGKCSDR
ncbi:MAG: hypothetical protein LRY73_05790 [Bacillus sp. (in: Bacteria)]|nr:hypothetical protein [Bacillus sp. (in: firmicutes)]